MREVATSGLTASRQSSAVNTAMTPGAARAAAQSMARMRACDCSLRRNATWAGLRLHLLRWFSGRYLSIMIVPCVIVQWRTLLAIAVANKRHGPRRHHRTGTLGPLAGRVGCRQCRRHQVRARLYPYAGERGGFLPRQEHSARRQLRADPARSG